MVILRGTKKVLRSLPPPVDPTEESTTALGDWFVNRIVVDRQPLLLLLSAKSLLAALVPARDVRGFPDRFPEVVADRLLRLGIEQRLVDLEVHTMSPVAIAKTNDRSVLGFMNDFSKAVPFYLDPRYWDAASLQTVEARLGKTPCHASKGLANSFFPDKKTKELLVAKWSE